MNYTYRTTGTCATEILFQIEEGVLKNVQFVGGCNGNLQAIGKLVEGMPADDVAEKIKGIQCGPRPTSCGDQLATAINMAIEAAKKEEKDN